MLRLKMAFEECKVTQAQLVQATGYSKALISRALSKGELPVDLERFVGAVVLFVEADKKLSTWIDERGLPATALFEQVDTEGRLVGSRVWAVPKQVDLDGAILAVTGRALLQGASIEGTMTLSRVALYLLEALRDQPLGLDTLGEIEVNAGRMLAGGAS